MRNLAAILLPSLALAETVAPIEIAFSENIVPEVQQRLLAKLSEGLAAGGYELLPQEGLQDKLIAAGIPGACVVGPCLKAVGDTLSVKYTLVARVEGVGSSYDVVFTVMETERGVPVAQATERCDVCSLTEVEATVERAAATVAAGVKAHAAPPPPPPKPLIVKKEPPQRSLWRWRGWKWVSLGLGAAAAGVGTYLVQIDGCTNDACTDQRSTGPPGMVAVGTGVVLIGGAGYLFAFGF